VDREASIEYTFEAGDYVVYIEVDWAQSLNRHLVLNTYGSNEISFNEMGFNQQ
jgi:calpain-15